MISLADWLKGTTALICPRLLELYSGRAKIALSMGVWKYTKSENLSLWEIVANIIVLKPTNVLNFRGLCKGSLRLTHS